MSTMNASDKRAVRSPVQVEVRLNDEDLAGSDYGQIRDGLHKLCCCIAVAMAASMADQDGWMCCRPPSGGSSCWPLVKRKKMMWCC
ncbi:hypothetical protein ACH5RR_029478 [Cinchona calisaya]|uniref:Uncharacterized protein n=1 Tax=Cinchona calisaya TaxID=153742 RepID=A0ABD2YW77_9GENT